MSVLGDNTSTWVLLGYWTKVLLLWILPWGGFLDSRLEPAALSLAVISFSIMLISSSKLHTSSLTCRLTISFSSCGSLFIRTEASKLPYDSATTPNDFKLLTCDSTASYRCCIPLRLYGKPQHPSSTRCPYVSQLFVSCYQTFF